MSDRNLDEVFNLYWRVVQEATDNWLKHDGGFGISDRKLTASTVWDAVVHVQHVATTAGCDTDDIGRFLAVMQSTYEGENEQLMADVGRRIELSASDKAEVERLVTLMTGEFARVNEGDMDKETSMTETTAAAIEINPAFVQALNGLVGPATNGKFSTVDALIEAAKETGKAPLNDELARLRGELAMRAATSTVASAASAEAYEDLEWSVEMVLAKDIFMSPEGKKSPLLNFQVPKFTWKNKAGDVVQPSFVPDVDPFYVFKPAKLAALLWGLATGKNSWLWGHTGSGKSTMVEQVAARLMWGMHRVNLDSEITRLDLIGRETLIADPATGSTVSKFIDGIVPRAMQGPFILLVDEADFGRSDVVYALQRALESKGLLVTEDGGRLVTPHSYFRFVATANTKGQGDEFGLYQGARVQSGAFMDRFNPVIHVEYMKAAEEQGYIERRFPALDKKVTEQLVKFSQEVRQAFTNAEVLLPMSPRSLTAIAENFAFFHGVVGVGQADAIKFALETCFLEKASASDQTRIRELADRTFK